VSIAQRSLYGGLLVTSLVVTAALVWSGWRLVAQQRELDARQVRLEAEASADAVAASILQALADVGDGLSARRGSDGGAAVTAAVVAVWRASGGIVEPAGALPFVPWRVPGTHRSELFAEAEVAEFGEGSASVAIARYRALAREANPSVRAGALLRLARVLRRRGDTAGALAAADELVTLGQQDIDGVPAALAGLDVQRLTFADRRDIERARRAREELRQRLDRGVWRLDRGTAEFYRDEVSTAPRPEVWRLAAALSTVWDGHGGPALSERGLEVVASAGKPVVVAWRANDSAAALAVVSADRFLASLDRPGMRWRLSDADDRRVAGVTGVVAGAPVSRVIGGGSSWTLRVWPSPDAAATGSRESLLIAATAGTVIFVWAAAALMARALRREARVAQLQSDFVAAVSHEFRSPLTTMRQMAEMLETDRVADEARRKQYYRVLASETARLQRLVERLLDFGRMEAGGDAPQHERLDLSTVVDEVVAAMAEPTSHHHTRIEIVSTASAGIVRGDPAALALAVRNLSENALKYSPDRSMVTVTLGREGASVAIAVSDQGAGIAKDEQAAIFGKFVRGRAAIVGRVSGTGVGLAAVKHVVDAHGGAIRLESEPGRGSTFTVLLPLDESGAPGADVTSAAAGSEA